MARKRTKKTAREKREMDVRHFRSLDKLVDHLFEVAYQQKLTWCEMARVSGLGDETIRKLGTRKTRYPQFRTVELLAHALGGCIEFNSRKEEVASIRISWSPRVFAGRMRKAA